MMASANLKNIVNLLVEVMSNGNWVEMMDIQQLGQFVTRFV
jgi:hypothetical protein